jgi:putative transposase
MCTLIKLRFWTCEKCQIKYDRDVNASINLISEGLRILTSGTGDKTCCLDVSRGNRRCQKSTTTLFVRRKAYGVREVTVGSSQGEK